eukprot:g40433.t1
MRGDRKEKYKILMGPDRIDVGRRFPKLGKSRTRGHSLRLKGKLFRMRKTFFTGSCEAVEFSATESCWASSLQIIRRELDVAVAAKGIK